MVLDYQGLLLDEHADPNGFNGCLYSHWAQRPAVAFDGSLFVVARFSPGASPVHEHIRGITVAPDGTVSAPFNISTETGIVKPVKLASRGDGETMAAFTRFVEGAPYESLRVRLSRITTCGICPSGFCSDGVCCDTACGGGDTTDCMACSVAAGAPADGVCAPLDGTTCGDGTNVCSAGHAWSRSIRRTREWTPARSPTREWMLARSPTREWMLARISTREWMLARSPTREWMLARISTREWMLARISTQEWMPGENLDAGMDAGENLDAGTGFDAGSDGPVLGGGDCSCRVGDAERAPSSSLLVLGALGILLSVKRRAGGARRSHHTR